MVRNVGFARDWEKGISGVVLKSGVESELSDPVRAGCSEA